jgi:AbrB family looped-hinge helix DNA binding protein
LNYPTSLNLPKAAYFSTAHSHNEGQPLYLWHDLYHMVEKMENAVKVDKQGRLVLPAHLREALGIKGGGEVTVRLDGSRVIIEPVSNDIKTNVQEWEGLTRSLEAEAFTEEPDESWKWMSSEYARRKLGLP